MLQADAAAQNSLAERRESTKPCQVFEDTSQTCPSVIPQRATQTLPLTDLFTAMSGCAAPAGSTALHPLQPDLHQPSSQLHMTETHTPLILLPASCAEQMRGIYMQQKVPQGNSESELCYTLRNSCKMGTKLNRLITNLLSHEGWLGVMVSLLDTLLAPMCLGARVHQGGQEGASPSHAWTVWLMTSS